MMNIVLKSKIIHESLLLKLSIDGGLEDGFLEGLVKDAWLLMLLLLLLLLSRRLVGCLKGEKEGEGCVFPFEEEFNNFGSGAIRLYWRSSPAAIMYLTNSW